MTTETPSTATAAAASLGLSPKSRQYPARWEAPQVGEFIAGEFLAVENWEYKGQPVKTYLVKIVGCSSDLMLTVGPSKSSKDVPAEIGMIVGLTGTALAPLEAVKPWSHVVIEFGGMGTAKKNMAAPKLWRVYA